MSYRLRPSLTLWLRLLVLISPLRTSSRPTDIVQRDVYTEYPYVGPAIPIADWSDQTVSGDGKGFVRLNEPPAVWPSSANATNNINTIALAYIPNGMNVHFSTPFGIGTDPVVYWGASRDALNNTVTGNTTTYDRTPPCSAYDGVTLCSQFFHDVQIPNLASGTEYFYSIPGGNGTTPSPVLSFSTAAAAGDPDPFSLALVVDMGYTNAEGTYTQMINAISSGAAFVWHGGDLSYADDWFNGILPCVLNGTGKQSHCYNGTDSYQPYDGDLRFNIPLPDGAVPDQGTPQGGDMSAMYETNWDLWQNWMNPITSRVPYMTIPGNHEATCSERDGPNHELTAYMEHNMTNSTYGSDGLNYYSCPASQRNFTAYQHRFRMPGDEVGGKSNFWYSFDYGLAHFLSFDAETDFAGSGELPIWSNLPNASTIIPSNFTTTDLPARANTTLTASGPFGTINGSWEMNENYEQRQWVLNDLQKVNRTKTPWLFVMGHRPMYSSDPGTYMPPLRAAFESMFLEYKVDAYISGHIHWYERLYPLTTNGTIVWSDFINNGTYVTGKGTSLTHLINGAAGSNEGHSAFSYDGSSRLNVTAYVDQTTWGLSRVTVSNATTAKWEYVHGLDGRVLDEIYMVKGS